MKRRRIASSQLVRNTRRRRTSEEERNWLDLPRDVMLFILSKLDPIEILRRTQFVCFLWFQLAKEPLLFRSLLLPDDECVKVIKEAVDRSCGELVEISIHRAWCTEKLLHYVVKRSSLLKLLHLANCDAISDKVLIEACGKLPLLEELDLSNATYISYQAIEEVGRSCSQLKYFRLNYGEHLKPQKSYYNQVAFSIADNMPQLWALRVSFTRMTNQGLRAILNKCCDLESLDLGDCCYFELEEDLWKRCVERIKDLSLPIARKSYSPPIQTRMDVNMPYFRFPQRQFKTRPLISRNVSSGGKFRTFVLQFRLGERSGQNPWRP